MIAPRVARDLLTCTTEELLDELARETRVPGAGPAAALTVASAAALVAMAARFSRDDWAEAGTTVAQAEALRRRAVELAGEVSDALEGFLAAQEIGDPRPEARDFRLGRTLDRAADVPLAIAAAGSDVAELAAEVVAKGDGDVRADAASAALIAHGAACAAAHLVEINLASLPDDERVKRARGFAKAAGEAAARAARTA